MTRNLKQHAEKGAGLIEVMLTVLILVIVMAAVFAQIDNVTKTTKREAMTVDLVQQNRDFVDLFVRDIHMTGYPHSLMYANAASPQCLPLANSSPQCSKSISVGIVAVSPTSLRLEGDIYGDGNVYSVLYTYFCSPTTAPCAGAVDTNVPPDPNCPCLRRSAVLKINADPVTGQSPAQYYTEVQNVIDPSGMAQGVFTYFDANGTQIAIGAAGADYENNGATIQSIDAIKVNLNVRSTQMDISTGQAVVHSLAAIAELEN